MGSFWVYACSQHPCEATYEYFERYKCYLEQYPDHGLQLHELITDVLDGMLPEECYVLRMMAGRPLLDCTPSEVWNLIEERAENTRPHTEYSPELLQLTQELIEQVAVLTEQVEVLAERMTVLKEEVHELKSAPEPTGFSPDDEEVPLSMKDRDDEEIVDEELHVVPTMRMEVVPAEEWISPPCADRILEQKLVITRNHIISPMSNIFLSYHVQNGGIKEAPCNKQVRGSLERTKIHNLVVMTTMIKLTSDQVFYELCINWKTRKKSMGKVQNSVNRSNNHSGDFRPALAPMKLRLNWKKRKKGKCMMVSSAEFSLLSYNVQKNRASFGWKPGWKLWKNASHNVEKKNQRFWTVEGNSFHQRNCPNLGVRKFDGRHPWAPNI